MRYICDVGLLGAWWLVWLSRGRFPFPGAQATLLGYSRVLRFLICTGSHWGEARLRWSIGKIRTFGLGWHVLHLRRAADWLLAKVLAPWGLMLGARLG